MTTEREGNVLWQFDSGWHHGKYDDWAFYRKQYQSCIDGTKAVDIIAVDPDASTLWLIEAKDYRRTRRDPSKGPVADEVARKAHDTLAGLVAAAVNAVDEEQRMARIALKTTRIRVVLHLEQATKPSKLFPAALNAADIRQKLCRLVRAIDRRPLVMSCIQTPPAVPWTTQWLPTPA